MRSSRAQEVSVAVTALIALVIFAGAVLVLGRENRLFASKFEYRTVFPEATGLRVGSPVTLAGVRVGGVTKIVLPTDPKSLGIYVYLEVDEAYTPRVREGTEARQVTLQFIANEKAVELNPGDPARPALADGATIPVHVERELFETGRSIADALSLITLDMQEILTSIKNKEGLVGRAIVDPEFGKKGLAELEGALSAANAVLSRINRGEGLIGRALVDERFASELTKDLQRAVQSFAAVSERLEAGDGILGAFTRGEGGEALVRQTKDVLAAFSKLAAGLEAGQGVAGALLKDDALRDRVIQNLDKTLEHLASITKKIDEGQGTLGLLVNDRQLHDDAQQLVTGAKGKTLASRVLRHYYRKGADKQQPSDPVVEPAAPGDPAPR
jgi:phospholipid/cholesterol/gamma-HCH transport system substrate-binding protein